MVRRKKSYVKKIQNDQQVPGNSELLKETFKEKSFKETSFISPVREKSLQKIFEASDSSESYKNHLEVLRYDEDLNKKEEEEEEEWSAVVGVGKSKSRANIKKGKSKMLQKGDTHLQKRHVKARRKKSLSLSTISSNTNINMSKETVPSVLRRSVNKSANYTATKKNWMVKKRQQHVLKEIKDYQKSYDLLIPKVSFARLCREIFADFGGPEIRVQVAALECLQESAEMYLVQFFEDSYLCTMHANRTTLMNKDLRLARRIGGRCGFYI